jgi:hypothetical protein
VLFLLFDGKTNVEFSNRCDKAWAAYWASKEIFRRFEANRFKRMQMLERFVGPSLLWCAGSWKLTKQQRRKLNSIQRQMVMKMLNFKSRPGETTEEIMKRLNSKVTDVIIDSNIPTFRDLYCRSYFRWAGSLFSILNYDPNRITYHILRYKDLASLRDYAARHRGRQGHVGSINAWRFETFIFRYFEDRDLDWRRCASDEACWAEHQDDFVRWMSEQ